MQVAHAALYTLIALVLLTGVGNWACRQLFSWTGLKDSTGSGTSTAHPAGWVIGWLERLIIAIGIVTHSWEVMAAVIALKTVARFKDLDNQDFAEYFLVGSLFSIFWAVLITSAWLVYDRHVGIDLRGGIAKMVEAPTPPEPGLNHSNPRTGRPPG